jgi:hypothetical protein
MHTQSTDLNGRPVAAIPAICERKLDMTVLIDAGKTPATNVGVVKRRSRSTRQMFFDARRKFAIFEFDAVPIAK